jgi:hypothetical protein
MITVVGLVVEQTAAHGGTWCVRRTLWRAPMDLPSTMDMPIEILVVRWSSVQIGQTAQFVQVRVLEHSSQRAGDRCPRCGRS